MNNAINRKGAFYSSFFLFALTIFSFFTSSCELEDPVVTDPPVIVDDYPLLPDSIHDLAAYLSTSMEVLMVDPEYVEEALELLELSPASDNNYVRWETLPNGEIVPFYFYLEILPIPELYYAAKTDMELEIGPQQDGDGVWFRLWRNAECGELVRASNQTTDCQNLPELDPITGAISYHHDVTEDYKVCEKGTGLCLERLKPVGKTKYYDKLCNSNGNTRGNVVREIDFQLYRCDY